MGFSVEEIATHVEMIQQDGVESVDRLNNPELGGLIAQIQDISKLKLDIDAATNQRINPRNILGNVPRSLKGLAFLKVSNATFTVNRSIGTLSQSTTGPENRALTTPPSVTKMSPHAVLSPFLIAS
ncbi:hypothetical protein V6N12_023598 [Hibiscus sabdariffa]|uniref:Uncharacterized protein n=1 Tax=Hibiscus sabdariffa TaxID=183260 RepID=A0ABR2FY54_9ROSI